jgi:hypothetical protein
LLSVQNPPELRLGNRRAAEPWRMAPERRFPFAFRRFATLAMARAKMPHAADDGFLAVGLRVWF